MRTKVDVVRSLKRHVALFLDADFDVRFESQDLVWERPCALIDTAPQVLTGSPKIVEATMPITIYLYPKQQSDADAAKMEAMRVEEQMVQAFRGAGHGGRPCRCPLFNYDGQSLAAPLPEAAKPDGMIWLIDFNTDTRRDPEDETLQTVLVEGRVRWLRVGEEPIVGPEAKELLLHGEGLPAEE